MSPTRHRGTHARFIDFEGFIIMALKLIGAGFGRTGTMSLKLALEEIGLGPCYHMMEISGAPERASKWHDVANGKPGEWDAIFEGYVSTVDWPAARYWRELSEFYPEAKVLLSKREANGWHKSVMNTIYPAVSGALDDGSTSYASSPIAMATRIVQQATFDGRLNEAEYAIGIYEKHNREVRDAIPPERLLVYEPGDGWEPLCKFLDVPVPASDYPHANTTEAFQEMFGNFAKLRSE